MKKRDIQQKKSPHQFICYYDELPFTLLTKRRLLKSTKSEIELNVIIFHKTNICLACVMPDEDE